MSLSNAKQTRTERGEGSMFYHAELKRNVHGLGAKRDVWSLAVFDGTRKVKSNLTYDDAHSSELSFTDQIRARLADLGFTAREFALIPDSGGYRINDVQRLS